MIDGPGEVHVSPEVAEARRQETDALIAELRLRSTDTKWDLIFEVEELSSLFRAETVILNAINDRTIEAELRAKREPFLQIALKLAIAERNKRCERILELLTKMKEGTLRD